MQPLYDQIKAFILEAGHRLREQSGKIEDIGVTKQYLTTEDLRIERGLKQLIKDFDSGQTVFAEEENDTDPGLTNSWIIDPISGTKNFIKGKAHYAIVATHVIDRKAQFAIVYDPSVDELFTAHRTKGVFLNDQPIRLTTTDPAAKVIVRIDARWEHLAKTNELLKLLANEPILDRSDSQAINYCDIIRGRAKGLISLARDSFPNFAGNFLLNEAGGFATNLEGKTDLKPADRFFVAGTQQTYQPLFTLFQQALKPSTQQQDKNEA